MTDLHACLVWNRYAGRFLLHFIRFNYGFRQVLFALNELLGYPSVVNVSLNLASCVDHI